MMSSLSRGFARSRREATERIPTFLGVLGVKFIFCKRLSFHNVCLKERKRGAMFWSSSKSEVTFKLCKSFLRRRMYKKAPVILCM